MNIEEISRMLNAGRINGSDEINPCGETRPRGHINENVDREALENLLVYFENKSYEEKMRAWKILGVDAMKRISYAITRKYGGSVETLHSDRYIHSVTDLNDH